MTYIAHSLYTQVGWLHVCAKCYDEHLQGYEMDADLLDLNGDTIKCFICIGEIQ
jgi:hypothetical protein